MTEWLPGGGLRAGRGLVWFLYVSLGEVIRGKSTPDAMPPTPMESGIGHTLASTRVVGRHVASIFAKLALAPTMTAVRSSAAIKYVES
jgi:hypothetical protein